MKATAMRAQTRKAESQLRLKMETGDDLHEIDFDQMKIENKQYVERIDERNKVCCALVIKINTPMIAYVFFMNSRLSLRFSHPFDVAH
jgi:hypothetical protein